MRADITPADARHIREPEAGGRIVSLLASATEIVCDLGLEDRLVGISHECDHPARILDRPRLSRPRFDPARLTSGELDRAVRDAMAEHRSVYEIDADALARLAPDLILTQAACEVCAVPTAGVREIVRDAGLATRILSLDAHTLEEIVESIEAIGTAAGAGRRAAELRAAWEARLEAVARVVGEAPRPRVLSIEWLDPPFTPGHWVPQMIELAAGVCLAGEAGAPSREARWGDLAELDPDVLIVMPCGYGLEASRRDADRFGRELLGIAPRAIEDGRAFVVDGSSYFNRSGPRVVTGVEILAGLLHPALAPPPPPGTAEPWSPAERREATTAT
ncbi:MAG: ABC transporter substrate-binding protein [Gemmatimonadota bacterium]